MSAAETVQDAEAICLYCLAFFRTPNPWRDQFCSDECRTEQRRRLYREREQRRADRAARLLANRLRCARWHEANGGKVGSQPWLAGAPAFDQYLPGGMMSISLSPAPRWPIDLRNTRALHGAMTAISGVGHHPRWPTFALRATPLSPSGWAVYWWQDSSLFLARRQVDGVLFDRPTSFTFGPLVRLRAPVVKRRGRRRLRIDTITPVVVVSSVRTKSYSAPSRENLIGTLGGEWLQRFGLEYIRERELLQLDIVETKREQEATIQLGGKYGDVKGWEGSLVVETNAVGHWLIETAARVGLGSRTAFGLGQIRVSDA